jgi:hypothetical protein
MFKLDKYSCSSTRGTPNGFEASLRALLANHQMIITGGDSPFIINEDQDELKSGGTLLSAVNNLLTNPVNNSGRSGSGTTDPPTSQLLLLKSQFKQFSEWQNVKQQKKTSTKAAPQPKSNLNSTMVAIMDQQQMMLSLRMNSSPSPASSSTRSG